MEKNLVDYSRYTFNAEDDWGDYDNGKRREPWFDKEGYSRKTYLCADGKWHNVFEHRAKWIFFNGEIPDGLEIDHIIPIRNGGTNKLSNLRCVTRKENKNNEMTKINRSNASKKMWADDEFKKVVSKKISEANKGERSYMFGKKHSEETKKKMSETHKGKHLSEETKEKMSVAHINNEKQSKQIYQYTLNGELIRIWPSGMECRRNGFDNSSISACCLGKLKTHKGFKWYYA